ncbi:MAG: hypothetical protein IKV82_08165 [Akkermansia sp.]|nr:hypothetical protein [Akkermansia sp.]
MFFHIACLGLEVKDGGLILMMAVAALSITPEEEATRTMLVVVVAYASMLIAANLDFLVMMFLFHNAMDFGAMLMMRYGNGCFGLGGKHAHQGDCYDG